MDLLSTIESHKHVLDNLYSVLPTAIFSIDAKLIGKIRHTLCGKFKQLESIIQTTNQQWWDKFFLQQYLDTKISPRGLRVLKDCPPFLDTDDKKEWAGIDEFCTAKWMGILISHRTTRFSKLTYQDQLIAEEICGHNLPIPLSWLEILKKNTH